MARPKPLPPSLPAERLDERYLFWRSQWLVAETVFVGITLAAATLAVLAADWHLRPLCLIALAIAQALWLNRCYLVGHEAVHRKLFPQQPRLNDLAGQVVLLPLLAPLRIYRKIHAFHHGCNRQAPGISTLDTFVVARSPSQAVRWGYHLMWLFLVFGGGFFIHTLVSIVLFLGLPTPTARQISPAFNGWTGTDRLYAWLELAGGIALHGAIWAIAGREVWFWLLALPLLIFAWVWSMLLYVYHYDTPIGMPVQRNVRSLRAAPVLSWLLLNFNEHSTHHADPQIPWHQLPQRRLAQAPHESPNESPNESPDLAPSAALSVWQAIWQQRRGPNLVVVAPRPSGEPQP
ncbi:MAG TPA: fatty acid desaturase [Chroococcidiopsis sp.]